MHVVVLTPVSFEAIRDQHVYWITVKEHLT